MWLIIMSNIYVEHGAHVQKVLRDAFSWNTVAPRNALRTAAERVFENIINQFQGARPILSMRDLHILAIVTAVTSTYLW